MNSPNMETKPVWIGTRYAVGKKWTIELWPNDDGLGLSAGTASKSSYLGRSSFSDQWVRVSGSRPFDGRDSTLLHELIHLVSDTVELGLKEHQISVLAETLFAFLRGFGLWTDFPWPDREEPQHEHS